MSRQKGGLPQPSWFIRNLLASVNLRASLARLSVVERISDLRSFTSDRAVASGSVRRSSFLNRRAKYSKVKTGGSSGAGGNNRMPTLPKNEVRSSTFS
jgi:hypothetical protein